VRGELRTMSLATWEEALLTSYMNGSLGLYIRDHGLGEVVVATGFLLASAPDTVRAPDIGFVRSDRATVGDALEGYYPGAPDLAVEVISPNDLYTEVDEKVSEWLAHGTRMVLVVNPRGRSVAVHWPGRDVRILGIEDTLDGEDVVPGWTLAVRDLFGPR
jgi:Uma2 family endonuclease